MNVNVLAAFIGYLSFMAAIIAMCLLVYFNAERLEAWVKHRFKNKPKQQ